MDKIDFVLPWVDGSDKEWIALKNKYWIEANSSDDSKANSDCRYHDYGLLKYWFRAVERFTPWVNRVFFVTCGQKPDWLDESNPKLRLVDHKDYIPAEYLPTFQSNTIELNLHRIADLSEHFVLFNDDMFLLRPVAPEFFFRKGLPVLSCDLGIPYWFHYSYHCRLIINNTGVLLRSMNVEHLFWKNIWKFIDVRNLGFSRAVKNLLSFSINRVMIPGEFGHQPESHLKSTFEEIWRKRPQILDKISRNRFRYDDDVNQWLACGWNMMSGRFYPANEKRRACYIEINKDTLARICDVMKQQSFPQICFREEESISEIEDCYQAVSKVFDELLPEKSSFEK